jgi:hypothetical protein
MVALNPHPPNPAVEIIGDPTTGQGPVNLRYGLKEVALQKLIGPQAIELGRRCQEESATQHVTVRLGGRVEP